MYIVCTTYGHNQIDSKRENKEQLFICYFNEVFQNHIFIGIKPPNLPLLSMGFEYIRLEQCWNYEKCFFYRCECIPRVRRKSWLINFYCWWSAAICNRNSLHFPAFYSVTPFSIRLVLHQFYWLFGIYSMFSSFCKRTHLLMFPTRKK